MSRSLTRAGALLGAVALGVLAALGTAAPASAEPGNIDPSIPRTLTIHKYELTTTSPQAPGTGQAIPGGIPGGLPLEGAEFTVTLIPSVNLLTPGGWTTAGQLTPATAAPLATGASTVLETDATGTATFTGLPIGLYLVTETGLPDGVTDATAPFLVTLPFPTGSGGTPANEWIYDVNVYPKNSTTELTKTRVTPAPGSVEALNPDLVRWAINATVPSLPAGTPLSQFVLSDTIPTDSLEYVATPPAGVAPTGVTATNAAGAAVTTLIAGTDYTIETVGATQTVTFTASGRTKLTAIGGGTVTFTVLTRAIDVPAGGSIVNTASSTVNGATETVTGTTPIGELTIFAYATPPVPGGTQTPLAGAVFQLYPTEADANAGTNAITVGGVSQWTSQANGQVVIPALVPGTYYVREVTPPAGFQIPVPATQPVQVVAGQTSISAPVQNYLTVPHSQVPAWVLPLTGGDGALWLGVGGSALLVVGVGAAVIVARRRALAARPAA